MITELTIYKRPFEALLIGMIKKNGSYNERFSVIALYLSIEPNKTTEPADSQLNVINR